MKSVCLMVVGIFLSQAVFAQDYERRVRQHETAKAAAKAEQDYVDTVTKIVNANDAYISAVYGFAARKRASIDKLKCYDRYIARWSMDKDPESMSTPVDYTSRGGMTVSIGIHRGSNVLLGFVGTAVMMPFFLPNYVKSVSEHANRPVYPPEIGNCYFNIGGSACVMHPAYTSCVDANGVKILTEKHGLWKIIGSDKWR